VRQVTLLFLRRDDEILLAMKKRGFGVGKWNGVGGKVQEGESVIAAAIREAHEEIGVRILERHLQRVANIDFTFEEKPEWSIHCHTFITHVWEGHPIESEEMAPQWFHLEQIPFHAMWVDDAHWLPLVLAGKRLQGAFHFTNDGSKILKQSILHV
jgi:ADP-ribose pyrophosphatase YjhB (NUDIX family)